MGDVKKLFSYNYETGVRRKFNDQAWNLMWLQAWKTILSAQKILQFQQYNLYGKCPT